jgi:hypothetical protein
MSKRAAVKGTQRSRRKALIPLLLTKVISQRPEAHYVYSQPGVEEGNGGACTLFKLTHLSIVMIFGQANSEALPLERLAVSIVRTFWRRRVASLLSNLDDDRIVANRHGIA